MQNKDYIIKCEAIQDFTLGKFDELKNIKRKGINQEKHLYIGDIFECTKKMAEYLLGDNPNQDVVIKIIEVIPNQKSKK
jgi:uncharacterized membrane-anchored protein YjiN (DUF445 family)